VRANLKSGQKTAFNKSPPLPLPRRSYKRRRATAVGWEESAAPLNFARTH